MLETVGDIEAANYLWVSEFPKVLCMIQSPFFLPAPVSSTLLDWIMYRARDLI